MICFEHANYIIYALKYCKTSLLARACTHTLMKDWAWLQTRDSKKIHTWRYPRIKTSMDKKWVK